MTRRMPFVGILSLLLGIGLFVALPVLHAAPRIGRDDQVQAPRWGSIEGETDIQGRRSAAREDIQAPRGGDTEGRIPQARQG